MTRKKKQQTITPCITSYMEKIDENMIRIYKKLIVIEELQKHIIQQQNELEARIQVLKTILINNEAKLDKIAKIMTAKKENKLVNRIKRLLKKCLSFL